MICTCTLNPSLDYYLEFTDKIIDNKTNRSELEYYEAGGKGINISIVLNNLQIPTRAYGFLGGFTKDFYINLLQEYTYIEPNFTNVDGHTRINVKIHDGKYDTDLNATGPYITDADMKKLSDKVDRLSEGDYFCFAGVCPNYLEDDVIEMLKDCVKNGVKVVLDTNANISRKMLPYKPFLVKSTSGELAEFEKKASLSADEVKEVAKKLHAEGAQNVLVLTDENQTLLCCDDGLYECDVLHNQKTVNTVGTGDSLTAGFLMNYIRSNNAVDSFKFGTCCSSATAYSKGLATREKIDSFYDDTEVRKLD